jgi:hypothetical protein
VLLSFSYKSKLAEMNQPPRSFLTPPLPELCFDAVNDVQESWEQVKEVLKLKSGNKDIRGLLSKTMRPKLMELSMQEPLSNVSNHDDDLLNDARTFDPLLDLKPQIFFGMLDTTLVKLGPNNDMLEATLKELGAKHQDFGVTAHDYELLGKALCFTLAAHMESKWNDDLEASWKSVYMFLSETMKAGVKEQQRQKEEELEKEKLARKQARPKKPHHGKTQKQPRSSSLPNIENHVQKTPMQRPPKSPQKKPRPSLTDSCPTKRKNGIRGLLTSPLRAGRDNATSPITLPMGLNINLIMDDDESDGTASVRSSTSSRSNFSLKMPKALRRPSLGSRE